MSPLRRLCDRVWPPTGRHRAVPCPERIQVPLDDLIGRPWPAPRPPYGAAVTQAWHDCPYCDKATAGVKNKDGWTCGECLGTVLTEGVS